MKTSKIKAIQANGTYKSNYGLLYKFEYELEDGTVINANHKTLQSPFNDGDEVEYEIKGTKDGFTWGTVKKPQEQTKDDSYVKGIEVGHAINNAVNMLCAGLTFDDVPGETSTGNKIYLYAKHIMVIAEKLKNE